MVREQTAVRMCRARFFLTGAIELVLERRHCDRAAIDAAVAHTALKAELASAA